MAKWMSDQFSFWCICNADKFLKQFQVCYNKRFLFNWTSLFYRLNTLKDVACKIQAHSNKVRQFNIWGYYKNSYNLLQLYPMIPWQGN